MPRYQIWKVPDHEVIPVDGRLFPYNWSDISPNPKLFNPILADNGGERFNSWLLPY